MKTQLTTLILLLLVCFPLSINAQSEACVPALPSRLVLGARGRVLADPPNNLRAQASPDTEIIGAIPAGSVFRVLAGSVCKSDIAWWQVEYRGVTGWTAEGQGDTYWVEPSLLPELETITVENAARLQPIAMLGVDLINDLAWSPDGKTLVAAGSAGLWRYDLEQPESQPYLVEGYEGFFRSAAYSPDGSLLATGSDEGVIRLWNTATWRVSGVLQDEGSSIEKLTFSPDGMLLASGSADGAVNVWDVEAGKISYEWIMRSSITDLVFNPNGESIVATSEYYGESIVATSEYHEASIFNFATLKETNLPNIGLTKAITFSPDGSLLAIGCNQMRGDGAVPNIPLYLWDIQQGRVIDAFMFPTWTGIQALAFADADTLLINFDNRVSSWKMNDLDALIPLSEDEVAQIYFLIESPLTYVDFTTFPYDSLASGQFFKISPDRSQIAIVEGSNLKLIDLQNGDESRLHSIPFATAMNDGRFGEATFSPTQPLLALASANNIHLINTRTGIPETVLSGHELEIWSLIFSADGKKLASGSGEFPDYGDQYGEDGGVRVWDMDTRTIRNVLTGYTQLISLLRFSADGNILFTSFNYGASGGNAGLWDLTTQTRIDLQTRINFIAFNPQNSMAAVVSNDRVNETTQHRLFLWDTLSNLQITLFEQEGGNYADVVFSPDGKLLLQANTLWDVETGKLLVRNDKYDSYNDPVFSPDSTRLLTLQDSVITLWNAKTTIELWHVETTTDGLGRPVFNADGSLIIYGSQVVTTETGSLVKDLSSPQVYLQQMSSSARTEMSGDNTIIGVQQGEGVRLWGIPADSPTS